MIVGLRWAVAPWWCFEVLETQPANDNDPEG